VQSYVDQEQQRVARERPHDERHAEVRSEDAQVPNGR